MIATGGAKSHAKNDSDEVPTTTPASQTKTDNKATEEWTAEANLKAYTARLGDFEEAVAGYVEEMIKESAMEIDKELRKKRNLDDLNAPSKHEGLLHYTQEEIQEGLKQSKYYASEDDGIRIPKVHPYFNLNVDL